MAVLPSKGVPMGRPVNRPIAPVSKPMLGGRPLVGPIQAGTVNPALNAMRRAAASSRAGSMQKAFTPSLQQQRPRNLLGSMTKGPPVPGGQLQPIGNGRPVTNPLVPRRPNMGIPGGIEGRSPGSMIPGYNPGMVPPPRNGGYSASPIIRNGSYSASPINRSGGYSGTAPPPRNGGYSASPIGPRQLSGSLNQGLGFPGQHTGPGGIPIDERFSFPGQITGRGGIPIDERFARSKSNLKPKLKPKPGGNLKPKLKPKPPLTKAQRRAAAFKLIRKGKAGRRSRQALAKKRGRLKGGPRSDLSISPELLRRIARQQIGRQ